MSLQDLQAVRAQQEAIAIHANTAFDVTNMDHNAIKLLSKTPIKISASNTLNGMTVSEFYEKTKSLSPQEQTVLKISLLHTHVLRISDRG